jgi:uncharacterized protein
VATRHKHSQEIDALIAAAQGSDPHRLATLLDNNIDVNLTDRHGVSALMVAAGRGRIANVKLLLTRGANVNLQDFQGLWPLGGQTALMFAAKEGREEVAALLIEAGANVNAQDSEDETALMKAVNNGHFELVQTLLAAGATIHLIDQDDQTALMKAEAMGQIRIAELLKETEITNKQR